MYKKKDEVNTSMVKKGGEWGEGSGMVFFYQLQKHSYILTQKKGGEGAMEEKSYFQFKAKRSKSGCV